MRGRLILATLLAMLLPAVARTDESIEQLVARAESARPEDRPPLYVEAARRQLEAADQSYTAGKIEAAHQALQDVAAYSDKARDAALQSNKKLKDTEIAMRKMASRLRDMERNVAFDEQPSVHATADHLEQIRTELLNRMFAKKGGKENK
jgi:L-lactate utilization protein LutB